MRIHPEAQQLLVVVYTLLSIICSQGGSAPAQPGGHGLRSARCTRSSSLGLRVHSADVHGARGHRAGARGRPPPVEPSPPLPPRSPPFHGVPGPPRQPAGQAGAAGPGTAWRTGAVPTALQTLAVHLKRLRPTVRPAAGGRGRARPLEGQQQSLGPAQPWDGRCWDGRPRQRTSCFWVPRWA